MRQTLLTGASSFAHLLGRAAPKAAKVAEEDEDKKKGKRAAEEDDEKDDGDDEGDGPEDGKSKKAAKAEDTEDEEEDKESGEDEKDDSDKRKKAKGKRAEGDDDEEGDDGSDGADMRNKGARSARLRERARCAAIFADASAGKNPALAAQIAFGTDLPRGQAVAVLRAGGLAVAAAGPRLSLDARMASVKLPVIGVGDGDKPTGAQGLAAQILAAGKKRRGEA